MITYSYGCEACGAEFEKEQRISDAPVKKCPKCGKSKARRLISQGNFILKGGGWYSDGYSSASAPKKSESTTTASESPPKKDSIPAKSETSPKTEAKPEKKSPKTPSEKAAA